MNERSIASVLILTTLLLAATTAQAQEMKFLTNQVSKARALIAQKDYDGALKELRCAMFVSDTYIEQKKELWQYMGYCYYAKGREDLIIACYKVAFVCASHFDDEIDGFLKKKGITVEPDYEPKYLGVFRSIQKVDTEEQVAPISGLILQEDGKIKATLSHDYTYLNKDTKDGKIAVHLTVPGLKVGSPATVRLKGLPWGESPPWDDQRILGVMVPDFIYAEYFKD